MEIIDNFLPKDVFEYLHKHVMSVGTAWFFQPTVAEEVEEMENDNYMHTHLLYKYNVPDSSLYDVFLPFIEHPKLGVKSVIRMILNSYPYTPKLKKHGTHVDTDYSHKGAILYMNTCDGYTMCQGEKVYSVANRVLLHDPSIPHHSTTTTTDHRRVICNLNYF